MNFPIGTYGLNGFLNETKCRARFDWIWLDCWIIC